MLDCYPTADSPPAFMIASQVRAKTLSNYNIRHPLQFDRSGECAHSSRRGHVGLLVCWNECPTILRLAWHARRMMGLAGGPPTHRSARHISPVMLVCSCLCSRTASFCLCVLQLPPLCDPLACPPLLLSLPARCRRVPSLTSLWNQLTRMCKTALQKQFFAATLLTLPTSHCVAGAALARLYLDFRKAGAAAELHMYSVGAHGCKTQIHFVTALQGHSIVLSVCIASLHVFARRAPAVQARIATPMAGAVHAVARDCLPTRWPARAGGGRFGQLHYPGQALNKANSLRAFVVFMFCELMRVKSRQPTERRNWKALSTLD